VNGRGASVTACRESVTLQRGLWGRLKRVAFTDVRVLMRGVDERALGQVERVLVEADFGSVALELTERLEDELRRRRLRSEMALRDWLEATLLEYLADASDGRGAGELRLGQGDGPGVLLLFGVNGVGKTTTVAKIAAKLQAEGTSVALAAADTYRAGAAEQLAQWAARLGVPCFTGSAGADPAAVTFDAIEAVRARGTDAVIVDTAGRLHTHGDLMDELRKVVRVAARRSAGAPHESLLVLDGTVGQNALQQGKMFAAAVPITGIVVTKLDGTAKGGAVVRLRRELALPIRFVGTGEQVGDLEPFDSRAFVRTLLGD